MRILYIDCGMGAAGDMLTAALLELLPNREEFVEKLNLMNLPKVRFEAEPSEKCGITGTHMKVWIDGEQEGELDHIHEHHSHKPHFHASLAEVDAIVDALMVSEWVKEQVKCVYEKIAKAESTVHGVPVTQIHFHEVGKLDAIADVTAVCMLLEELAVEQIVASPIHVGSGSVKCAHGILPVPAPATAEILKGFPIYGGTIEGELCTPTGAALLTHFVTGFGDMPVMSVEKIGYGMGKKDFPKANCVRVLLGEAQKKPETVTELSFNVDDMTAEEVGFAMERLFEGKALEVFTIPCNMKKDRPGQIFTVICEEKEEQKLVSLIFKYTTTIGIRKNDISRYKLNRRIRTVHTEYGPVREKLVTGYGVSRYKYEYEDLARIAREQELSLAQVRKIADEGVEE